jgi:hypothetical protein
MLLPSNNEPPTDIIQDQEPEEDSTGMDRRDSQSADLNKLVIVVLQTHNLLT